MAGSKELCSDPIEGSKITGEDKGRGFFTEMKKQHAVQVMAFKLIANVNTNVLELHFTQLLKCFSFIENMAQVNETAYS